MGLAIMESELNSRLWQEIFTYIHKIRSGAGAHPASYSVDRSGSFLWGKAAGV